MSSDDRHDLANRQAALVADLAAGAVPAGVAPREAARAHDTLAQKRRREAFLAAPRLAEALGEQFAAEFDRYAGQVPYPGPGGPVADAAGFGAYLDRQNRLPATAAYENLLLSIQTRGRARLRTIGGRFYFALRVRKRVFVLRFI